VRLIIKKCGVKAWTGFVWLVVGSCGPSNVSSDSMKGGEFLDQLSD
jgi:hypothetical protein